MDIDSCSVRRGRGVFILKRQEYNYRQYYEPLAHCSKLHRSYVADGSLILNI